jgi:hypothetical protein
LCVMKMIALPLSASLRMMANRSCDSWGVSTAVGSSRIKMSALR